MALVDNQSEPLIRNIFDESERSMHVMSYSLHEEDSDVGDKGSGRYGR